MSEFSIPPYIYFYPSDWLQNPEIRRLEPAVKGFYIDLICQLHFTFPYGHISLLNPLKAKQFEHLVNQNSNPRVELLVVMSVAQQLKIAENIESDLSKYLPYDRDVITMYLNVLEQNRIISKTPDGIYFVRRMVKDFKRRVVAYSNGLKGGNPNIKRTEKAPKKGTKKAPKKLNNRHLQNQVNQNSNPEDNQTLTLYNNNKTGRDKGGEGESVRGETNFVFKMQQIYDKSFADLQSTGYSKTLTEEGFSEWRKFVDFVIEKNYNELFHSKFLDPKDFDNLWKKGFTKEKWAPVLERILATGIKPEHNLFFRIPEFEKIVFGKDKVKTQNINNVGEKSFSSWTKSG